MKGREQEMAFDRQKALETALTQIEKQFGKGAVMRLGQNAAMNVDAISTGSLSLDMALGIGGLPRGRITEIYGPESSGKTTLALHCIAEGQKNGGMQGHSELISTLCSCPSPTQVRMLWRSLRLLCVLEP